MFRLKESITARAKFGAAILLAVGLVAAGCQKKEAQSESAKSHSEERDGDEKEHDGKNAEDMSKGVGPIHDLELGALDAALAAKGETVFSGTCSACHKLEQRYVGPALAGVTKRRKPEWIMNMIMNPAEMTQKDPVAKALLGEYMTQMSVIASEEDARALLEYFRKVDGQ